MQEYNRKRTETPEESIKQWTTALKPNKPKYNKGKKLAKKNLHTVYQSLQTIYESTLWNITHVDLCNHRELTYIETFRMNK